MIALREESGGARGGEHTGIVIHNSIPPESLLFYFPTASLSNVEWHFLNITQQNRDLSLWVFIFLFTWEATKQPSFDNLCTVFNIFFIE